MVKLYGKFGFRAVTKDKFNPEYASEAMQDPEVRKKAFEIDDGEPDVVYLVFEGNRQNIFEQYNEHYTPTFKTDLEYATSYDECVDKQTTRVEERIRGGIRDVSGRDIILPAVRRQRKYKLGEKNDMSSPPVDSAPVVESTEEQGTEETPAPETGKVSPVMDVRVPLDEATKALQSIIDGTGRPRGAALTQLNKLRNVLSNWEKALVEGNMSLKKQGKAIRDAVLAMANTHSLAVQKAFPKSLIDKLFKEPPTAVGFETNLRQAISP